jgi:peptidoglycan hydrolase CwlO-like protein
LWREEVHDNLRSLRTAVAMLGVLAVIAAGLAVWALVTANQDEGGGSTGASPARVSALEDKVDELESELERVPSSDDLTQVRDSVKELQRQVQNQGDSIDATQQATKDLRKDVDDLAQRVDDLEQQGQPTPSPTP